MENKEKKIIKKKKIIPTILYIIAFIMIGSVLQVDYNIYKNNKDVFIDIYKNEFEDNSNKSNSSKLNMKTYDLEVLGTLYIPKIDLNIPIYKTKSQTEIESAEKQERAENYGAALWYKLDDLGMGKGSRTLLSSHNGLSIGELFTNIPKLTMGDKFYVKLKGKEEPLTYEIFELDKTLPNTQTIKRDTLQKDGTVTRLVYNKETGKYQKGIIHDYEGFDKNKNVDFAKEEINVKDIKSSIYLDESEELLSLQTCIPIFVNSHRLLVTGKRVKYDGKKIKEKPPMGYTQILYFVVIGIVFILIIRLILDIINNIKFNKIKKQISNKHL